MKTTRANRVLSIILSLSIVIGIVILSRETVLAESDAKTGLTYTIADGKATITGFTAPAGFDGALVIPGTLGGASVTSIGEDTFFDCTSLTSISIPNSVTSIGDWAFSYCSNLTSIEIPSSVTNIGEKTFSGCISLTSISIPNSVTSIGRSAFSYCSNLTCIEIPSSVTNIEEFTFYQCTNLTSISIPNSVTDIGRNAFCDCTNLTSIEIPSSVTSIGDDAFYACNSLESITIPSSVTSIGQKTFQGCSSLTSISIPNRVTSIGGWAFFECSSLNSIEIPSSVTSIGRYAFQYCSALRDAYFYGNAPTMGDLVFGDCAPDFTVHYLSGKTGYTNPWYGYPAAPAKPTGLKGVSSGYNSNKLTWDTVAGATGYSIYRSTSPDSGFTYLKGVTGTSYTNTGLTTGKTYYYQIKAYVMVGSRKVMSPVSATISAKPIPAKPTGLKVVSAGYDRNKITWNTVTGATGYSIYRSTSPDSGFTYLKGVTTNSYTNTGLTTGTTYYYQIKAYTLVGTTKVYSATSTTVNAKPVPAKPTGLKATVASTTSIKVSWNTVAGATGYSIYRSTSPDSGFTYLKGVTTNSYTNTGLTTGKTYYYKVRAYTMVGTTKVYSNTTSAVGAKP